MKISPIIKMHGLLILVAISFLFFNSCSKLEDTNPEGVSKGTLKDSTNGSCLPVTVQGIFKVDSILTNENYVDIEVNVSIGGNFDISTDSINGFVFRKKGTIGEGLNRIRLYATGKPIAASVNTFTIRYGISSCTFKVTVYDQGLGTALYTLGGSPGNCSISSINGNYIVGLPMTSSNTAELAVNVNTVGTYFINGNSINGVQFSASGTFLNPGIQTISLAASGIPATSGSFTYPVTNLTTSCSFPITYTNTVTNAGFVLSGSPFNCTGAVVMGTYTSGTAVGAGEKAVIHVNVTSPGIYNISTTTVNGISFSASGTFNITGQIQVTLAASGTPTIAGSFDFPLSGGGSTCGFSVLCN